MPLPVPQTTLSVSAANQGQQLELGAYLAEKAGESRSLSLQGTGQWLFQPLQLLVKGVAEQQHSHSSMKLFWELLVLARRPGDCGRPLYGGNKVHRGLDWDEELQKEASLLGHTLGLPAL